MQRVVNCIYVSDGKMLMLQKPRRGWWSAPGGKMENGESIVEAVKREFCEETGLTVDDPQLVGVFTVVIMNSKEVVDEWMFYNFKASKAVGTALTENYEGILKWHNVNDVLNLPMAEGDKVFIEHAISGKGIVIGTFKYTKDFKLLKCDYSVHNQ